MAPTGAENEKRPLPAPAGEGAFRRGVGTRYARSRVRAGDGNTKSTRTIVCSFSHVAPTPTVIASTKPTANVSSGGVLSAKPTHDTAVMTGKWVT